MKLNKTKLESNKLFMISLALLFLSLIFGSQLSKNDYSNGNLSLLFSLESSQNVKNLNNDQIIDFTSIAPDRLTTELASLNNDDIVKARISLKDPFSVGYFPTDNAELEFLIFSKVNIENISNNGFLLLVASGNSANMAENDLGNGQTVDVILKAKRNIEEVSQPIPVYQKSENLQRLRALYDNKIVDNLHFELLSDTPDKMFAKLITDPKESGNVLTLTLVWSLASLSLVVCLYALYCSPFLSRPTVRARSFGASLVEFGLIVSLIALVALIGVRRTGEELNCTFSGAATSIGGSAGSWPLKIPAAGGIGAAVGSLQSCCNKYTGMGFFQSLTPSGGYYNASCSLT